MIMIYVVVAAAVVGSFVVACRLCRTENKTQKADATRSLFSFGRNLGGLGAWLGASTLALPQGMYNTCILVDLFLFQLREVKPLTRSHVKLRRILEGSQFSVINTKPAFHSDSEYK